MTKASRNQNTDPDDLAEALNAARAKQGAAFRERMKALGGSDCHAFNVDLFRHIASATWIDEGYPKTARNCIGLVRYWKPHCWPSAPATRLMA